MLSSMNLTLNKQEQEPLNISKELDQCLKWRSHNSLKMRNGQCRKKWMYENTSHRRICWCQSLIENGKWDLVKLLEGYKAIGHKWDFRVNHDEKGQVEISFSQQKHLKKWRCWKMMSHFKIKDLGRLHYCLGMCTYGQKLAANQLELKSLHVEDHGKVRSNRSQNCIYTTSEKRWIQ